MKVVEDAEGNLVSVNFDKDDFDKDDFDLPEVKQYKTKDDVIAALSKQPGDDEKLHPILNLADNQLYMSFFAGMGESSFFPLKKHHKIIRDTINNMYVLGELVLKGDPFVYGAGSPLFQRLELDTTTPF